MDYFFSRSFLQGRDGASQSFSRLFRVFAFYGLKDLFGMGFQCRFHGNVSLSSFFALSGPFQG